MDAESVKDNETKKDDNLPAPSLPHQNWTGYLIYCNSIIVLGSAFMYGYNLGVVNGPYLYMNEFLNATYLKSGRLLTAEELNTQWSVAVTVYLLGGIVGSTYFPGLISRRLGLRTTLLIVSSVGIVGELLIFVARYSDHCAPFMVGRAICGLQSGLSMVAAPALIAEHAPAIHRGACGTFYSLGIAVGLEVANLLGLSFILGSEAYWHYLFVVGAGFYAIHLVGLIFVVEGPRRLADANRQVEAIKALAKLRNTDEEGVHDEFEEIKQTSERERNEKKVSALAVFKDRRLWWPLIIVINLHINNQMTGLSAVSIYATLVINKAGLSADMAAVANFGLSFAAIIGNIVCAAIIDRLGRRSILLGGTLGTALVNVFLILVLRFDVFQASIAGFALYLIFFTNGPGPVSWFLPAELFNPAARPISFEVAMFTNWAANIIVSFVFPVMQFHIGYLSFLPFAIIATLEFIFFLLFLPETMTGLSNYSPEIFAPGKTLLQLGKKKNC